MDKLKLCMISPEFFPVWGGVGSYTIELLKHLPENVDVHVVTLKRNISTLNASGLKGKSIDSVLGRPITIHYLSTANETFFYNLAFQYECLKTIPKLHSEHRFDILHSHLSHMPDIFLQLSGKNRIPTIATVHSTIKMQKDVSLMASGLSDMEWSEVNTLLFFPVINFLQKKYVKRVSNYIAVSNVTRKALIDDLKVDAEGISLVYNGIDTHLFNPPTETEMAKKYSTPTIVYIGRIMAKKGLNVLIRAMPKILKFFPESRFIFVGGGNISFYKGLLREIGVAEKNVSFIGYSGYFDRTKILHEATVFVNPSFFENCSISILEAMSSGVAVVASDVGGNPEIIKSGENGILVPSRCSGNLADSIISLLRDENLNRSISKAARRTVEFSFSAEKCAAETYRSYRRIVG